MDAKMSTMYRTRRTHNTFAVLESLRERGRALAYNFSPVALASLVSAGAVDVVDGEATITRKGRRLYDQWREAAR